MVSRDVCGPAERKIIQIGARSSVLEPMASEDIENFPKSRFGRQTRPPMLQNDTIQITKMDPNLILALLRAP